MQHPVIILYAASSDSSHLHGPARPECIPHLHTTPTLMVMLLFLPLKMHSFCMRQQVTWGVLP
jgi:hypothetical protein